MENSETDLWLVIDTNPFLHFKQLEQIDWHKITSSNRSRRILLRIPLCVLDELDKKKWESDSKKLRERAEKAVARIGEWSKKPINEIGENIGIEVFTDEPSTDEIGNPRDQDNHVLGVLLLMARNGSAEVALVSGDAGLGLRARKLGFQVIQLREEDQLPRVETALDRELREQKEKLRSLESRLPELAVALNRESSQVVFRFRDPSIQESDIPSRLLIIQRSHPKSVEKQEIPIPSWGIADLNGLIGPSAGQVREHNQNLDSYYERYETYLEKLVQHEERISRTLPIEFWLINSGVTFATDIHVNLHLPDGFEFYKERDLPEPPSEPSVPQPPVSVFQMLTDGGVLGSLNLRNPLGTPVLRPAGQSNVSGVQIVKSNSYDFSVKVSKSTHGVPVSLGRYVVEYSDLKAARSFIVTGQIHCDQLNAPTPISFQVALQ